MYYKLRNDVLFRQYEEYGLITDNSEFGYRMLNDQRSALGEKYVSKSGAVMLSTLDKYPKNIDEIVKELLSIFVGVDEATLKKDTEEFLHYFFEEGYLCESEKKEEFQEYYYKLIDINKENTSKEFYSENCDKSNIKTKDFLRSIHIEIASACNERCVHCYIPHKYKEKMMDSSLFYRIVEEGRKMHIIHVTLSGGEPLLHNDIIGFLRKCRELDLSVNVLSNLTMINDDIIDEMKKNPLLSIQTSIYAMDSKIHDNITKLSGSLDKTINGVKKIIDAGIPIQISCPVMKQNKDDFPSVIRWGKNNNISVSVEPVIFASYDHSCDNLSNRLSVQEVEKAIGYELDEGYEGIIMGRVKEKEALKGEDPICSICRYSFCISVEGNVYPCVGWQSNIIDSLDNHSLQEIWEKSEKIEQLMNMKRKDFSKCVDCIDRGYCTVCMMCNSNENPDGDIYKINDYHCKVAQTMHKKLLTFQNQQLSVK